MNKKGQEEEIGRQLHAVGLRKTPARVMILGFLRKQTRPVRVDVVLKELGRRAPDQATVYRNLSTLVDVGLAKEVLLQSGARNYEIADRVHHHHVLCESCGLVEKIAVHCDDLLPKSRFFQAVTGHNLEFTGVCKKCARRMRN